MIIQHSTEVYVLDLACGRSDESVMNQFRGLILCGLQGDSKVGIGAEKRELLLEADEVTSKC
jgi:hypothetical protein